MPLTVCTTVSNPRRDAHGPTWLKAHSETTTMPGRNCASDSGGLRVLGPLVHGAHHAAGALRGNDRLLELERIPLRHRLTHGLAILRHAEHAERGGAMVREVAVEVAPASVLGRIDAHHRVALGRHGRPVHLHVVPAAERGG